MQLDPVLQQEHLTWGDISRQSLSVSQDIIHVIILIIIKKTACIHNCLWCLFFQGGEEEGNVLLI